MAVIEPTPYQANDTSQYVESWRTNGFVLLSGLLDADLFTSALSEVDATFPTQLSAAEVEQKAQQADFGSGGALEFPCRFQNVNLLTLDHTLVGLAKACLGVDDIRLIQADTWAKYGSNQSFSTDDNRDQRMHMDFGNNTMLHPPLWDQPEALACIISFDDTADTGGGTGFVGRRGNNDSVYQWPYMAMPGMSTHPWVNARDAELAYFKEKHPEIYKMRLALYEREDTAHYLPGTVLFYRHDLWHRGTPLNPGKVRRVMNLGFRDPAAEWVTTWNPGWVRGMYDKETHVEKLFPRLDVEQRTWLGFPPPGHKYWTAENFAAVSARWEPWGMDMTPYHPTL